MRPPWVMPVRLLPQIHHLTLELYAQTIKMRMKEREWNMDAYELEELGYQHAGFVQSFIDPLREGEISTSDLDKCPAPLILPYAPECFFFAERLTSNFDLFCSTMEGCIVIQRGPAPFAVMRHGVNFVAVRVSVTISEPWGYSLGFKIYDFTSVISDVDESSRQLVLLEKDRDMALWADKSVCTWFF